MVFANRLQVFLSGLYEFKELFAQFLDNSFNLFWTMRFFFIYMYVFKYKAARHLPKEPMEASRFFLLHTFYR